ncbi:MAG: EamA/RhaT family transporter, partial [Gammaproteobacteria bacterium]|nr:EamA/RhaT family transporter [Gammaproteobacteria bacterium]
MPNAYFYAGLTLLMWATVATAFKLTLNVATVLQTLWVSTLSSSFTLLVICAARGELGALYPAFRRTLGLTLLAALLNPVAYYLILFEAYDRLPAQLAQPINITWTIVLALM